MERIIKYFKDTLLEMKHVKWPSTNQAIVYTLLVIIVSAVVALMLSGFDFIFTRLLEQVI